jgi:multidrug efflux pump subunit AcrA (membrane-fusion protein)
VILKGPDPSRPRATGQVVFVAPDLDRERQTLLVKAAFNNPDGALRNNERVSATLVFDQRRQLAIPQQAVLLQAGKTFVFLAVSAEEARRRLGREIEPSPLPNLPVAIQVPVRLGTLQNGAYPVLEGLSAADTVVVGNLAQLRSGLSVQSATALQSPFAGMRLPAPSRTQAR